MVPDREPVRTNQVQVMVTCLCDAFFDDAARAAVECLERAGCQVACPRDQTCCGQPAYTTGDWDEFRRIVRHVVRVFDGDSPVVVVSGSCAAAMFHEAPLAFQDEEDLPAVRRLASRTWELADFLVNGLGVAAWSGRLQARLAVHDSCHTRGTGTIPAIRCLLRGIDGVELLDFPDQDQCCGFGGVFSVSHPHISTAMGRQKVTHARSVSPDFVVSADMSCLMHQQGIARHQGVDYPVRHVAQLLRDAGGGPA